MTISSAKLRFEFSGPHQPASMTGPRPRVLIVEDERIVALHLRQRLSALGYKVSAAVASGTQALHEIREKRPDVILMDINLEGELDGIETTRLIPPELHIPVIYLTAYSEETTLERARGTLAYGYLLKPFSDRELHATIQMVLKRRKIDIALQKSEQRLSLALDAAEMGSWELDAATRRIVHVNKVDQIVGGARDVSIGSWEALLDLVHSEDRPAVQAMVEHLSADGTAGEAEFRTAAADDTRRIKLYGKQFPGHAEGARRIIGVIEDVTAERAREEQLREATAALVAQKDKLSEALDKAMSASRAKSDFLAAMSHELRTPMNAILGFGQMLSLRTFGRLSVRQREYVGNILYAADHLLKLINDLLDLSKIEAAQLQLSIASVEVAPLLKRVASSLTPLAAKHRVELTIDIDPAVVAAADITRLGQVLINLVSNAIKYNRAGGSVRVAHESCAAGWVRIAVSDTGLGIPEHRQCEMFEPFNRLGAENGPIEGTGIGLSLSKRLVELMGGRLGFESTPGTGSRFWIDLPAQHQASSQNDLRDALTGLPGPLLLSDRISGAIASAPRYMKKVAVLSLNLDGFTEIRKSLGLQVGEKLLQSVASRIVESVRASDTVSRQADDKFIVLLSAVTQSDDVAIAAQRLSQNLARPHSVDEHDLSIGTSIGISVGPDDGLDAETLIKNADIALYRARGSGRASCRFS
jgi:diguanylate cyclase (GGDEF)-like protein